MSVSSALFLTNNVSRTVKSGGCGNFMNYKSRLTNFIVAYKNACRYVAQSYHMLETWMNSKCLHLYESSKMHVQANISKLFVYFKTLSAMLHVQTLIHYILVCTNLRSFDKNFFENNFQCMYWLVLTVI